jgi:hypothetical protein
MQKIELPTVLLARALASVESLAYKKDDDPSIAGVAVRVIKLRDGASELAFIATNRVSSARFVCEAEYADKDFAVTLPLAFVRKTVAVIGDASSGSSEIARDDRQVKAKFYGVGALEYMIDTEIPFPSVVEATWPTDAPLARDEIGIDPARAQPVGKAFSRAGAASSDLRFELRGPARPIVVTSESAPELSILLMPCVTDEEKEEAARQLEMFPAAGLAVEKPAAKTKGDGVAEAVDKFKRGLDKLGPDATVTLSVPGSGRPPVALKEAKKTPAPKRAEKKRSHHKKK